MGTRFRINLPGQDGTRSLLSFERASLDCVAIARVCAGFEGGMHLAAYAILVP